MMLRHNGEIHQIMVGEILHIMSVVHRAIMHLSLANLLHGIIIMESSSAAYHIDNLAVALVSMKTTWTFAWTREVLHLIQSATISPS